MFGMLRRKPANYDALSKLRPPALDGIDEILGINMRNALIQKYNPRSAIERARDKVAAKVALEAAGISCTGTVAVIDSHQKLAEFKPSRDMPDAWAIKPARGSQGDGILLAAMVRLPTIESDGKANLHQRAIGAGIDMESGKITRAVVKGTPITHHPDTGVNLIGFEIPGWKRVLELASRCGPAVGLGYCGADIVLDVNDGPLVIEVNAHPGIEIQNICQAGLKARIAATGEDFR